VLEHLRRDELEEATVIIFSPTRETGGARANSTLGAPPTETENNPHVPRSIVAGPPQKVDLRLSRWHSSAICFRRASTVTADQRHRCTDLILTGHRRST